MKQRSHAFDLLCGICIVRMITQHVVSACGYESTPIWTDVYQWTFYFMSFFFLKAGYFNKTIVGNTPAFLSDKTRRLLVPYFAWGAIGTLVYFSFVLFVFPPNHANVKSLEWKHLWETAGFWGNPPLWFLFSFYLSYVVAHFINKMPSRPLFTTRWGTVRLSALWLVLAFPFVSSLFSNDKTPLYFCSGNIFMGVFLFEAGRLWRRFMDANSRTVTLLMSILLLVAFVVINVGWPCLYTMSNNTWDGPWLLVTLSVLCAVCGLSGFFLSINTPRIPVLGYFGEHSMVYFVSHYLVILLYRFTRSAFNHSISKHEDDFLIILATCFIFSTMLVPLVERTPLLSGRYKEKKSRLWIV